MSDEYLKFLSENDLSEEDVLPMLRDKTILADAGFMQLFAELVLSLPNASDTELEQVKRFGDGLNQNANSLIRTLIKDFRKRLITTGMDLPDNVETGVFPLNSFNARAVPRGNTTLLLLDTGMMEVLEVAVALAFSDEPSDKRAETLIHTLRNYIDNGDLPDIMNEDHPYNTVHKQGQLSIYSHALNASEVFVLLHEYAHLSLGHIDYSRKFKMAAHSTNIEVLSYSHALEFEADLWAQHIILRAYSNNSDTTELLPFAVAAPVFFLGVCVLLDEMREVNRSENTHPSGQERFHSMLGFIYCRGLQEREHSFIWWRFEEVINAALVLLTGKELMRDREPPKNLNKILMSAYSFSEKLNIDFG